MQHFFRRRLLPLLARHLAALACIALVTLLLKLLEPYLQIQIIALIYLLPVMLSVALWGLSPGVLAGLLAFLAFNYYFIQPYYTLQVHTNQDLITLIIFLVVAFVISQLIGRARAAALLARSREWEATRMYELISALSSLPDTHSIARALAEHSLEAFACAAARVTIDDGKGQPPFKTTAPAGVEPPEEPALRLPMHTARGQEGELSLWTRGAGLSAPEMRLLQTFASQAALALERVRLGKSESKARVLEESDQLKSSLLNSVSHELRSPLAAIKASVSSLRSGAVDWEGEARQELLATIEEETDHLNLLVGNLLDMSRIESGALNPQKRWNSISEIAAGVVTKMRKQLQSHDLRMDFPPDLPLVPTDYIMIGQVFTNLVSNSVKYAPEGTPIRLAAAQERECLHVQVSNQSPAVPDAHLERIFDKFYRITAADRVTGTGLGLSICKGIIQAHGGKIWAQNQPEGFVFHFTLPLTLNGILPDYPKEAADE